MSLTVLIYILAAVVVIRVVTHFQPSLLQPFSKKQLHSMQEGMDGLFWAGVTALLIVQFLARPFYIPSESMLPTLRINDFLLVNRAIYDFTNPVRGDIVVFESTVKEDDEPFPKHLIKRVIGVENDTIAIKDGTVYLNGLPLEESYKAEPSKNNYPYPMGEESLEQGERVKPGHIFVMGDNRNKSNDSRYIGQIPLENLVGRAEFRFFPPHRLRSFNFPRSVADQATVKE